MTRRPPRSTLSSSSAASDVYKRQLQHRTVIAGGQALRMLQGDRPGGAGLPRGLLVSDAEVLRERRVDGVAAESRAQRVGADADQVLTARAALVHGVERRDRGDLGIGELELAGAELDAG